ncbi:MAG: hypothetical protein M9930_20015 [Anaerolineae bacterium]|nr:hypothetical protein [Anaerolineae bacterium]
MSGIGVYELLILMICGGVIAVLFTVVLVLAIVVLLKRIRKTDAADLEK